MTPNKTFDMVETFRSIQGEGPSIGKSAFFLRLSGCSLRCKFCDTLYSWEQGKKIRFKELYTEICNNPAEVLVFTGGEPLLQETEIFEFLSYYWGHLKNRNFKRIEIETNGTIFPSHLMYLNHMLGGDTIFFNVSPKLENSGNNFEYEEELVMNFVECKNVIFKFVLSDNDESKFEIMLFLANHSIHPSKVYLMPEGKTKEDLEKVNEKVIQLCIKRGYTFCPRLHVMVWGDKQGV